jgi:hypothetical protein
MNALHRLHIASFILALGWFFHSSAFSADLRLYSLRSASVSADTIMLAQQVEGHGFPVNKSNQFDRSSRISFQVNKVLKGDAKLTQTTIEVADLGLFVLKGGYADTVRPPELSEMLLFLRSEEDVGLRVFYVYAVRADGTVVRARQQRNPGPYVVDADVAISWTEAERIVRDFLPQLAAVRALREIPNPVDRNRALFDWIRQHGRDFRSGWSTFGYTPHEPRTEWGGMEHEVFNWILESSISKDTWLAMQLASELSPSRQSLWSLTACEDLGLTHQEGREFLLAKLLDEEQPLIARRTAGYCLRRSFTSSPPRPDIDHKFQNITLAERERIASSLLPLATHEDRELRSQVLGLIAATFDSFNEVNRPPWAIKSIAALRHALLNEKDNDIISWLYPSLNKLLNELEWEELTGNSHMICVGVSAHLLDDGDLELRVSSARLPEGAALPVDARLEALDAEGKVLDSRLLKVDSSDHGPWKMDWHPDFRLETVSGATLSPGLWKVRLEGVAGGSQHERWTSWPTFVRLP